MSRQRMIVCSLSAVACAIGLSACTTNTRQPTVWESDYGTNGYLDYVYRCPVMADTSIECLGARGRLYLGLGETRMVVTPTFSSRARLDPLAAEQLPAETTLSISTSGREYAFRHTIAAFITVEETAPHRELAKTIRKKALQYAIELSPGYNEISNPELGELELTLQPGHHEIPLNRCMPHSEASGIYIYCHR